MAVYNDKQIIVCMMHTESDERRIRAFPPVEDGHDMRDTGYQFTPPNPDEPFGGTHVREWNLYRTIVSVSFYRGGVSWHYMLNTDLRGGNEGKSMSLSCATGVPDEGLGVNAARASTAEGSGLNNIQVFCTEKDLVAAVLNALASDSVLVTDKTVTSLGKVFVGWNLARDVWPLLVNKALAYNIPVNCGIMADPQKRYQTLSSDPISISNMYTQCTGTRKLPGLTDMLRFWGVLDEKYCGKLPYSMSTAIADGTIPVSKTISAYMEAMYAITCRYYGIIPGADNTDVSNVQNVYNVPSAAPAISQVAAPKQNHDTVTSAAPLPFTCKPIGL